MNSKNKIIFVNNNMNIGGVQKSLCNLLKEIYNDYDITLFLFSRTGDYLQEIPNNVSIKFCTGVYKYLGISQKECKTITDVLIRGVLAFLTKLFGRNFVLRIMNIFQKRLTDEYDCAISFLHDNGEESFYGGCNEFVISKIKAKKKIAFLHGDYEQCGANTLKNNTRYKKFDKIVACSDGCKASLVKCIPEIESRCVAIRNCNDYGKIIELAGDGIEYDKEYFNIVTVARLSKEKGIERAIEVVKYCIDAGYKVRYHIIGSGILEDNLKSIVREKNMDAAVFFYGNQTNPYKYMVNADLFLLTSYHEAAPMVFNEAACLGVPILSTKTTSTDEMILENKFGFVCENSTEALKICLHDLLSTPKKLIRIKSQLKNKEFNNESIVSDFKDLFV